MTSIDSVAAFSQRIPTIRSSDWFLRIPLAIIIIEQGSIKLPDFMNQAAMYGLNPVLFGLAAFAEIAGGLAIIIGGLLRNFWMTDALTRLGGLAISIVVAGVIWMIYFGPFSGWQLQGMLLAAGVFFMMRGNGDVNGRSLI